MLIEPADDLRKPRVLAVLPSLLPSAIIYTVKPLSQLAKQKRIEFDYVLEPKANAAQIHDKDLVIFVRNDDKRYSFILEEAKELRVPTIYDLDDNLWEIPANNPSKRYHLDVQMRQIEHYLRSVDLVKVYNPILLNKVKNNFNRRVYQALAGIDIHLAPDAPAPKKDGIVRIAYATARGAKDELYPLILPDLVQILQDFSDRVELILWRDCPDELRGYSNVRVLPVERNYENFIRNLSSAGYDIGLAPMFDEEFYSSKTNTKFRDYGLARIAGVYSSVPIYNDVQDGSTGLVVSNEPGAWYRAIARLIDDTQLRQGIQAAAYDFVREHYRQELMEEEWAGLLEKMIPPAMLQKKVQNRIGLPGRIEAGKRSVRITVGKPLNMGKAWLETLDKPGVKNEIDLSQPLPFEDRSVDSLLVVEALETVSDLSFAMEEIYRVCKHAAQVCIVARYAHHRMHQANPDIRQVFNEHTPRYWTASPISRVFSMMYSSSQEEPWGLLKETDPCIDFRCMRMELFYSPLYRNQTAVEKREARQKYMDVCELIEYHLLVVKKPVSEEEMDTIEEQFDYSDPEPILIRKYLEQMEAMQEQINQLQVSVREKGLEVERWANAPYRVKANQLLQEVNSLRSNIVVRAALRFTYRPDEQGGLPQAIVPLVASSRAIHGDLSGFRLGRSLNLQHVDHLSYLVLFNRPNLQAIQLGFRTDLPLTQGSLGIELVSSSNQSLARVNVPFNEFNEAQPVLFQFSPVKETGSGLYALRIFARNVDAPVYLYEYYRYSLFGLGPIRRKLFAGFRFAE